MWIVEALEPGLGRLGQFLRLGVTPLPAHRRLRGLLGGRHVLGVDDGVADQSNVAGDGL